MILEKASKQFILHGETVLLLSLEPCLNGDLLD